MCAVEMIGSWVVQDAVHSDGSGSLHEARHGEYDELAWIKRPSVDGPIRLTADSKKLHILKHPNIVDVVDQGTSEDGDWVRFSHVPGMTLGQRLARNGSIEPERAREILIELLEAVKAAHLEGIVHGHLTPDTIVLGDDGRTYVRDFGYAGWDADAASQFPSEYLAPELRDGGIADEQSDLYALGVIADQVLTGRLPGGLTRPSEINPNLDPAWDEWVASLYADRENRCRSAAEALRGLVPGAESPEEKLPLGILRQAWLAGPMSIVGIFLAVNIGLGMRLAPNLRFAALGVGVFLTLVFIRSLKQPIATLLFWGGVSWLFSLGRIHPASLSVGILAGVAGLILYVRRMSRV